MLSHHADVPELVPQLLPGKHRSPRKGACFMELASYLAGERWSDRPACTHPLLASLARLDVLTSRYKRYRVSSQRPSLPGHNTEFVLIVRTGRTRASADASRVLATLRESQ